MDIRIQILIGNIEKVIFGKTDVIKKIIAAMLSGGHILLEDVPGVGKTRLVAALAKSVGGEFNRIQFTPDLMPSDIMGFTMINPVTKENEFRKGAAMCNFLLADEINRASPKAQSSLLEIMEELQVSVDGSTYPLPRPFMTLATQNPVETYGTYHLPEAQMDRFIMKLSIGYPSRADEQAILNSTSLSLADISPVISLDDVTALSALADKVHAAPEIKNYIINIVSATRQKAEIALGASPRGSIGLLKASKALALIQGRDFVTPDDVREMAVCVLAHRLILSPKGKTVYTTAEKAIMAIVAETEVL